MGALQHRGPSSLVPSPRRTPAGSAGILAGYQAAQVQYPVNLNNHQSEQQGVCAVGLALTYHLPTWCLYSLRLFLRFSGFVTS
jgi:hypothetical protein